MSGSDVVRSDLAAAADDASAADTAAGDVAVADDAADDVAAADVRDGRSTRWDPHRRERRQAIIDAAVSAIEQDGPDVLTARIAELAGVPRTHVYRHFDGKRALDLAVSAHIGNELGVRIRSGLAVRGSTRTVIAAAIDEHLAWIEAHPNLYRFLARNAYAVRGRGSNTAADAKAAFAAELSRLVEGYGRALGIDTRQTERVIVGVVGLVDNTAAWWLDSPADTTSDQSLSRAELTAELTERVWLLMDVAVRSAGIELDPDAQLPAPD